MRHISRDFARPYVLENLEHLLAQEVECGNFVKLDAENYRIVCKPAVRPPSVNIRLAPPRSFPALPQHPVSPVSIHQRPTGCSQSVAHLLPTLPTSPVPSHQVSWKKSDSLRLFIILSELSRCPNHSKPPSQCLYIWMYRGQCTTSRLLIPLTDQDCKSDKVSTMSKMKVL